jgi:hypothetical protein
MGAYRKLLLAVLAILCLTGMGLSQSYNQMVENIASVSPILTAGKLNFVPELKRTSSNDPGIFVYTSFETSSSITTKKVRFFDSRPTSSFVHNYELTATIYGNVYRAIWLQTNSSLLFNYIPYSNSDQKQLYLQLNTGGANFAITSTTTKEIPTGVCWPLKTSSNKGRVIFASTDIKFYDPTSGIGGNFFQTSKPITVEQKLISEQYIDQVIQLSSRNLYIHKTGLLVWTDETVLNSPVQSQTITQLSPIFAAPDLSRTCHSVTCDVVILEQRSSIFLGVLKVQLSIAPSTVAAWKFPTLKLNSDVTSNMPVVFPASSLVAIAGSSQFYFYHIYEDRLELSTTSDSITYTGMQNGTLEVGDFDSSLYPNQRPCMALFADGANFKARMFVIQTTTWCLTIGCVTCTNKAICTECQAGKILHMNKCVTCGTTSPAAIYEDMGAPVCATTTTAYYAQGYRLETSQTAFVLYKPCTVTDCANCATDLTICQTCKTGYRLWLNKCTLCSTDLYRAIVVVSGAPMCVDRLSGYSDYYGKNTTNTAFNLIANCEIAQCKKCYDNYKTCTQCNTNYVLYNQQCTACGTTAPAGLIIISNVATCIDTSVAPYNIGYGIDPSFNQFRAVKACSVPNCKMCAHDFSICTECNSGLILYGNRCTACGSTAPAALLWDGYSTVTCVDTTATPTTNGYGRDAAATGFVGMRSCLASSCENCSQDYANCTQCSSPLLVYPTECVDCPSMAPSGLMVDETNYPYCVDINDYPEEYGKDISFTTYTLIRKCPVGCRFCANDFRICTQCFSSGDLIYKGKCITCGTAAPAAILDNNNIVTCVDTSLGTYSTGYGRDTTQTGFIVLKPCVDTNCDNCSASFQTCTSCGSGKFFYNNKCITCGITAPAAVVDNNGVITCISGSYPQGYGRDATQTNFVLLKPCVVVGCSSCPQSINTCTNCDSGKILYKNQCTACGNTAPAAILENMNSLSCIDTSSGTYAERFGRDHSQAGFVLLKTCSVSKCITCQDYLTCTQCQPGDILYKNKCITCGATAPSAILRPENGSASCVSLNSPDYSQGYRRDPSETSFYLLQACTEPLCNKCDRAIDDCEVCKDGFLLTSKNFCTLASNPAPTPTTKPTTNSPGAPSTSSGSQSSPLLSNYISKFTISPTSNQISMTLLPGQSHAIYDVYLQNLKENKTWNCAQTGCKLRWVKDTVTLTFSSPPATVKNGNVIIIRKNPSKTSVSQWNHKSVLNRLLQSGEDTSDIVIPGITVSKVPEYKDWLTTTQIFLFVLRTAGCFLIFPRFPKIAMLPDLLITISFALSMFLGPLVLNADLMLSSVGQVKIPWFKLENLVEDWDSETIGIPTNPNIWKHPVFCSFLDNYSQNTVGLLGLAVILSIMWWCARKIVQKQSENSKIFALATVIKQYYGMKFLFAKIHANSLEMMLYAFISFDKADASSKSIIGIVLAAALVGLHGWIALGATIESIAGNRSGNQSPLGNPSGVRTPTLSLNQVSPTATSPVRQDTSLSQKIVSVLTAGWRCMPTQSTKPVSSSKRFIEAAYILRNLGLCLIILKVIASAQTQLIIATCLQSVYFAYFVYCNIYQQKLEYLSTLGLEVLMLAVLSIKALSTIPTMSESTLENILGMAIIVTLGVAILLVTVSFGLAVVWTWKTGKNIDSEPAKLVPCSIMVTKIDSDVQLHHKDETFSNLKPTKGEQKIIPLQNHVKPNSNIVPAVAWGRKNQEEADWQFSSQKESC